jgi:hypothetical protein
MELVIDMPTLLKYIVYFLIFFFIVVFVLIAFWQVKRILKRPELIGLDKQGVKRRWEEIESMLKKHGEMTDKVAILEADKLLDQVLKAMTMPGQTMGERLKVAAYKYPKLDKVWWAHKIRNQLVHEASFGISHRTAKAAVKAYENALKGLGLL